MQNWLSILSHVSLSLYFYGKYNNVISRIHVDSLHAQHMADTVCLYLLVEICTKPRIEGDGRIDGHNSNVSPEMLMRPREPPITRPHTYKHTQCTQICVCSNRMMGIFAEVIRFCCQHQH